MKTVYLVRHGESEANTDPILRGPEAPLTEKGREQASLLAERAAKLPIEIIIASKFTRSIQTAEIIQKKVNQPIESVPLFGERTHPTRHYGQHRDDPTVIKEIKTMIENLTLPNFRLSDEENFEDLKERATQAVRYLENRPENNILVVSHGAFIRFVVGIVLFEDNFNGYESKRLLLAAQTKNTGITVLAFDPANEKFAAWRLLVWNDHAHLG